MKNAKALNLKNMQETIINYSGDQKDFDKIWNAFYQMYIIGFISSDVWYNFWKQCDGWYVDDENACVRDERNCHEGVDNIVWNYMPGVEYKA